MSNIKELRDRYGKIASEAGSILKRIEDEQAKGEERDASRIAELKKQHDKAFDDMADLEDSITRAEKQEEADRRVAERVAETEEQIRHDPKSIEERHHAAFNRFVVTGDTRALQEVYEERSLQVELDADGGYVVPSEQFVNQLWDKVKDSVYVMQNATVYQLNQAQSLGIPTLETRPDDADWTGEISTVSADTSMKFGKRELKPNYLSKLVKVSRPLLRNSPLNPAGIVQGELAYKFGITMEKGFLTGSGANQPLGVFTASANGISSSQDVSTGNTTTAIQADNLFEVKYSLKEQYQANGAWMFHRDALKQIAKLKDGDGQYLWRPGIAEGQQNMLLGRPVIMSEYVPNTFTSSQYVGIFGDWRYYAIAMALSLDVQRLNELYAATNEVGFLGRAEIDGMPVHEEAFARVKLA